LDFGQNGIVRLDRLKNSIYGIFPKIIIFPNMFTGFFNVDLASRILEKVRNLLLSDHLP